MVNQLFLMCASVCFAAVVGAAAASEISTSFNHFEVAASQAMHQSN
jgi:hypothetical protein